MPDRLRAANKLVGAKQTLKAIQNGQALVVFIAQDADQFVLHPILELCNKQGVEVVEVASMVDLGKACSIDVGAAVAALVSVLE